MRLQSLSNRSIKMSEQLRHVSKTFDIKNRKQKVVLNPNTHIIKSIFDNNLKNNVTKAIDANKKVHRSDFLINYMKIKNAFFEQQDEMSCRLMKLLERMDLDRQILFKEKLDILLENRSPHQLDQSRTQT